MATLATGAVTSSSTGYYASRFSTRLLFEGIISNPVMKLFMENEVINKEDQLSNDAGGTVWMTNALRLNSTGFSGDIDIYSNAMLLEKSSRSLNILKNSMPVSWPMRGTQTQQFTAFDIGSPVSQTLIDWASAVTTGSLINQVGRNTATTITQYSAADSGFTGDTLLNITGNNACTVPTYHYEANLGGVITTDANVNSGNTLSIKDFQLAAEIITSQQTGKPTWQFFKNKKYLAIALISQTGYNQLINEAVTAGQGMQLSQVINAQLAGGKDNIDLQQFMLPGLPFLFAVAPDSWLPRGVTLATGAETATTRRAIIVGRNAIDLAYGKGFTPAGGKTLPGVNIRMDTDYQKLNNQGYATADLLWGCKKTQQTGPGSGTSTAYDTASYVICHYSAS